ncbi:class F sortase [Haloechinothrix salitolerans]|uniref:Class F sortase n=1 Tax=Haloechinothrix salitolerans TaxID=926830 RepID=A0ABW2C6D3_9PSEU
MSPAEPVDLAIPSLDVTAPIMDLGLQSDGSLEVPPGADQAGWYTGAPTPGELGPAIIAAHVNWDGEDGPFARLHELTPGSRVVVSRADGTRAVFAVKRVEQYPKARFPTERVYGDIDHAGLRLITCGGEFDSAADSYEDNIIAFARLVAPER